MTPERWMPDPHPVFSHTSSPIRTIAFLSEQRTWGENKHIEQRINDPPKAVYPRHITFCFMTSAMKSRCLLLPYATVFHMTGGTVSTAIGIVHIFIDTVVLHEHTDRSRP